MQTQKYDLPRVELTELVKAIQPALKANYADAEASITQCPDLRQSPFHLAGKGLSGRQIIADIGGQPNLFPTPLLDKRYSMVDIARNHMQMSPQQGMIIGAGAGPFHVIGQNAELAPNFSWRDGFDNADTVNLTYYTKMDKLSGHDGADSTSTNGRPVCEKCLSTDCALMMNLYGCSGLAGPVLKITARKRLGTTGSLTDVIRFALHEYFGDDMPVSLGGVFAIRNGKVNFHIMPDFPSENSLPFKDPKQLNDWLTYHNFAVEKEKAGNEIVCLSVLHSADPQKKMGLRMEHTHCFSLDGRRGGHYHYDLDGDSNDDIEYEGYFNVAETIYRVDRPQVTLDRDLHD